MQWIERKENQEFEEEEESEKSKTSLTIWLKEFIREVWCTWSQNKRQN